MLGSSTEIETVNVFWPSTVLRELYAAHQVPAEIAGVGIVFTCQIIKLLLKSSRLLGGEAPTLQANPSHGAAPVRKAIHGERIAKKSRLGRSQQRAAIWREIPETDFLSELHRATSPGQQVRMGVCVMFQLGNALPPMA